MNRNLLIRYQMLRVNRPFCDFTNLKCIYFCFFRDNKNQKRRLQRRKKILKVAKKILKVAKNLLKVAKKILKVPKNQ